MDQEELKAKLTPEQFAVTQQRATEAPIRMVSTWML
jgi:peptide methionine sulfoxide reductase MsrB